MIIIILKILATLVFMAVLRALARRVLLWFTRVHYNRLIHKDREWLSRAKMPTVLLETQPSILLSRLHPSEIGDGRGVETVTPTTQRAHDLPRGSWLVLLPS